MSGTLFIVGTPIGNLDDISVRALTALREADFIAAEDTRRTGQLLRHFEISVPLVSVHQHNEAQRADGIVARLHSGQSGALVTDAGMPSISDPGAVLVRAVRNAGVPIVVVPGPAAVTAALAGSGAPADRFVFEGFLPRHGSERKARLQALALEKRTVVLYEAPHRLLKTLHDLAGQLPARDVTVARELTKIHEEFRTGKAADLLQHFTSDGVRGECTIVIHAGPAAESASGGPEETEDGRPQWLADALALVADGMSRKDAARTVAASSGLARRDIYQALLAANGNAQQKQ